MEATEDEGKCSSVPCDVFGSGKLPFVEHVLSCFFRERMHKSKYDWLAAPPIKIALLGSVLLLYGSMCCFSVVLLFVLIPSHSSS